MGRSPRPRGNGVAQYTFVCPLRLESRRRGQTYVTDMDVDVIVTRVASPLIHLVQQQEVNAYSPLLAVVRTVRDRVGASIVPKKDWSIPTNQACEKCTKFQAFLLSPEQSIVLDQSKNVYERVAEITATSVVPRAAGNHALHQALESSLAKIFFDGPNSYSVDTQRMNKLVYVLEHKYTKVSLSFRNLKGRDRLITQSLAKFCEDNRGLFGLFLSKISYTFESDGIERRRRQGSKFTKPLGEIWKRDQRVNPLSRC